MSIITSNMQNISCSSSLATNPPLLGRALLGLPNMNPDLVELPCMYRTPDGKLKKIILKGHIDHKFKIH